MNLQRQEPIIRELASEFEGKIILHKNFLDDRLVWAGNFSAAQEHEKFHGEWEREGELEFTTGVAYRFAPRWHAGVEYRNHRGYGGSSFSKANRNYSASFFGPSLHYAEKSWWLTASFLNQLGNAKGYTDQAREDIIGGRFYGEHHERNELRVKVGFSF